MKRRSFITRAGAASCAFPFVGCSAFSGMHRYRTSLPKGDIPQIPLGRTGIMVSRLGFGSHLIPELIARPGYRDTMIRLGFEGGITTFDVYDHSGYKQFTPMGKSLRDFRKSAVVSLCAVKETAELQAEIENALAQFHTDYIDLYRLYTVDDDRMAIMEKYRRKGAIRAIGVVSHDVPTMTRYLDDYSGFLDYVMIVFNFHHNNGFFTNKDFPDNDYTALIPRCERLGLGILGIKPMGCDSMIELARKEGFFENRSADLAQAMIHYVLVYPEIDCTMPAMNSMEEMFGDLTAAKNPGLSGDEERLLEDLSARATASQSSYLPPHYRWLEKWASWGEKSGRVDGNV